jgi:hypothetical protein
MAHGGFLFGDPPSTELIQIVVMDGFVYRVDAIGSS